MEKTRRETLAPFSLLAEPKRLLTLGLIPASGVVRAVVSESKAYLEVRTAGSACRVAHHKYRSKGRGRAQSWVTRHNLRVNSFIT